MKNIVEKITPQCGDNMPLSRSEQKFQAIVEAAEKVFIQLGYQKTSMDKIAEEAQVSKRTVYNHFENKDVLFNHILDRVADEIFATTSLDYDSNLPLQKQLTQILHSEWDLFAAERMVKLKRVVIAEYITTPNFINPFIEELESREDGLRLWLANAMADGKLKSLDIHYAFDFLSGTICTFTTDQLMFDQKAAEGKQRDFIINEVVEMFLARYELKT